MRRVVWRRNMVGLIISTKTTLLCTKLILRKTFSSESWRKQKEAKEHADEPENWDNEEEKT